MVDLGVGLLVAVTFFIEHITLEIAKGIRVRVKTELVYEHEEKKNLPPDDTA